jgi:predicted transcriptional regulator
LTMSRALTVHLSDAVYTALEMRARAAAQSPAEVAAVALEQEFGVPGAKRCNDDLRTEAEKQAARERFERHFGAVNLGHATGADNESIDADLARAYGDNHEES